MSSNLLVPVVLWSKKPPAHRISALRILPACKTLLTGTEQGQICLWRIKDGLAFVPEYFLCAHSSSIVCLEQAGLGSEAFRFVSAARNGELLLWDGADGRCLEKSSQAHIHTEIRMHVMDSSDVRLFCCGNYPEIQVLDARSLKLVMTLVSRVEPDWIRCLHILKSVKQQDVVIGHSNSGMVKIWTLDKDVADMYEEESKQIRCPNARVLTFCSLNPRTAMVVSLTSWQIFDASEFSLICSVSPPPWTSWLGGVFTNIDKVAVWCSDGNVYLYQLPRSKLKGKAVGAVPNEKGAAAAPPKAPLLEPLVYCVLKSEPISCVPQEWHHEGSFLFGFADVQFQSDQTPCSLIVRGNQIGELHAWKIPQVTDKAIAALQQEQFSSSPHVLPDAISSLAAAWKSGITFPRGILDDIAKENADITCTCYVGSRGRLLLGRRDGSVIIVAATQAISAQTLDTGKKIGEWPPFRRLHGHRGAVTCLLYPNEEHQRYEANHLLSGGTDFSVCLWDLNSGVLLHRFCVQCGEIERLLIPPETCNNRVLQSFCAIAADHSIALLGLKDFKCILLASKHIFPVRSLYWRPLDDFLVVECEDGLVYVWQMETGHLDRIISGVVAQEVIAACQEQRVAVSKEDTFANPAIQMLRAIKHKNIAAMRKVAASLASDQNAAKDDEESMALPMDIRGLRMHTDDCESHLVLFNTEALILELLCEEFGEPSNTATPDTPSSVGENSPFLSGLLSRVRDKADMVGQKLQQRSSPVVAPRRHETNVNRDAAKSLAITSSGSLALDITQLLMSFLHSWDLDADLDRMCAGKLGLRKVIHPLCFGLITQDGALALLLPTFGYSGNTLARPAVGSRELASSFTKHVRWGLSNTLTTQHLLTLISVTNALMELTTASFLPEQDKKRKLLRRLSSQSHSASAPVIVPSGESHETAALENAQIKQGWSLLSALHCVLLPDLLASQCAFKPARIELLARRWQERCFELREAAQALLLRELARIGKAGRRKLLDEWAPFLPTQLDASLSIFGEQIVCIQPGAAVPLANASAPDGGGFVEPLLTAASDRGETTAVWSVQEVRRHQATAVVLIGVIGSQFPDEITRPSGTAPSTPADHSLARATSQSLLELLVHPPSPLLPPFSPLRRAAIDLLGRGFAVWEAYLDISKVVLGLLELCCGSEKLLPSGPVRFPLSPAADTCRTARHAIALIAGARPAALITVLNKEIARYNQQAQHQAVPNTMGSPLPRSKQELLNVIDLLSQKQYNEVVDLMLPVGEILTFCLDTALLKQKSLNDVFPCASRFPMIGYCAQSRRLAFGGKNGTVAIHELRAGKSQSIQAHSAALTACSFSDDGKHFATYSADEGRLNFWQTSHSFLGMGQSQVKCIRQLPGPKSFPVTTPGGTPTAFKAKLFWTSAKTVTIVLPDGSEHRAIM